MENSKNSRKLQNSKIQKNQKDKNTKKLKNTKSAIDENLANRHHGSKKRFLLRRWKPGKQAPLALHASSCSAPSGLVCSLLSCFRFPALVLLRSCIHGLHLDRNSGAAPYRVIGVDKCHSSWDSPHRISFATVTSCSSCVCLLLLALRSRFTRWMSFASVTSHSDCVCPLSLGSL